MAAPAEPLPWKRARDGSTLRTGPSPPAGAGEPFAAAPLMTALAQTARDGLSSGRLFSNGGVVGSAAATSGAATSSRRALSYAQAARTTTAGGAGAATGGVPSLLALRPPAGTQSLAQRGFVPPVPRGAAMTASAARAPLAASQAVPLPAPGQLVQPPLSPTGVHLAVVSAQLDAAAAAAAGRRDAYHRGAGHRQAQIAAAEADLAALTGRLGGLGLGGGSAGSTSGGTARSAAAAAAAPAAKAAAPAPAPAPAAALPHSFASALTSRLHAVPPAVATPAPAAATAAQASRAPVFSSSFTSAAWPTAAPTAAPMGAAPVAPAISALLPSLASVAVPQPRAPAVSGSLSTLTARLPPAQQSLLQPPAAHAAATISAATGGFALEARSAAQQQRAAELQAALAAQAAAEAQAAASTEAALAREKAATAAAEAASAAAATAAVPPPGAGAGASSSSSAAAAAPAAPAGSAPFDVPAAEAHYRGIARRIAAGRQAPLRDDEEAAVREAVYGDGDGGRVYRELFTVHVSHANMNVLQSGRWLKDDVINMYIGLLRLRHCQLVEAALSAGTGGPGTHALGTPAEKAPRYDTASGAHPPFPGVVDGAPAQAALAPSSPLRRVWLANSFFWPKLTEDRRDGGRVVEAGYCFANVARWTKRDKVDVFACRLVLVPLNYSNTHWALGAIYPTERRVEVYDSLGGGSRNDRVAGVLARWAADEWADKKAKEHGPFPGGWAPGATPPPAPAPRQTNGWDCGAFMLACMDYLSLGQQPDFSQDDIDAFRLRVGAAILAGGLPVPLPPAPAGGVRPPPGGG